MSAPEIKICGVRDAAALEAAIGAHADYVGLVFYAPSPRGVTPAEAAALALRAAGRVKLVGLFVDADDGAIQAAVAAGRLDAVQLHGAEAPARVAQVRSRFGLPVWKAISVAGADDVARARAYVGAAELILFDAKTPNGALPGGMGLRFDWSLARGWRGGAWGLAGGLTPANVGAAIALTGAPLVDTSSGVETAPGAKDAGLIAAFCRAARTAPRFA